MQTNITIPLNEYIDLLVDKTIILKQQKEKDPRWNYGITELELKISKLTDYNTNKDLFKDINITK